MTAGCIRASYKPAGFYTSCSVGVVLANGKGVRSFSYNLVKLRYIHNEPHLWSNPVGPIKPVRRRKIGIESLSTQVLTSTKSTNSSSVTTQAHSE